MPDCPQIKEVEKRYAEAETALKAYERITLTNLAPAINQLRYAGNHLLRASSETDDAEREKHVLAAEWHSRRALYDAREATVIFLLDEFREFRDSLFTEDEASMGSDPMDVPDKMTGILHRRRLERISVSMKQLRFQHFCLPRKAIACIIVWWSHLRQYVGDVGFVEG